MNNFHIYEEIGRGQYSVVYKVPFANWRLSPNSRSGTKEENHWLRGCQISGEEQTEKGP